MTEDNLKKEYAEAGVDLPELQEENKEPEKEPDAHTEEPKADPESEKEEKPEEPKEPLQEQPKEVRKRSIYDDYKEKKRELNTERELREQAERERDELKVKLDAFSNAQTPQEKQDAKDDLEAFAQEINADPQALRKMRELFLKDVQPQTDESLKKDLEEFKVWRSQNSQALEKQLFEEEFQKAIPDLKGLFPSAAPDELEALKKELDTLSHSKDWHDKPLDYIAFKHKEHLSNLISPKKRGLESKGRKDVKTESFDFNPNADYSQMTAKEREAWEEQYQKMMKNEGLVEDSQGRKLLI